MFIIDKISAPYSMWYDLALVPATNFKGVQLYKKKTKNKAHEKKGVEVGEKNRL